MATAGALVPAVVTGPCLAQVVLPPDLGVGGGGPRPSPSYDLSLAALAEGRFDVALELATTEYRTANRTGTQRWIDSIAAAAVMAECHYELGNLAAAVAATDEALLLSTVHANWLLSVQFGATGPRPLDRPRAATWGKSRRTASPARVPDAVAIRLGTADPQEVLKRGGVLAAPSDRIIRPQEIARGLVTALYRHGDILGDLARDSAPLDAAARALARRAAPPNHYSQSWIDVAWGTALWAQGKAEQARPLLERGLVLEGSFDHPLAAWALIVLGRIALDAGQPAEAARLFEEATFTAADFGDARSLEEAFRWAFAAHMAAGTRGVPASIARGADWAAQTGPPVAVLASRMRAWQAECLAINGDARTADAALAQVDGRLLRAEPGRGSLGTDVGYARAMLAYTSGAADKGDAELDAAIALARPRSARLFQTMPRGRGRPLRPPGQRILRTPPRSAVDSRPRDRSSRHAHGPLDTPCGCLPNMDRHRGAARRRGGHRRDGGGRLRALAVDAVHRGASARGGPAARRVGRRSFGGPRRPAGRDPRRTTRSRRGDRADGPTAWHARRGRACRRGTAGRGKRRRLGGGLGRVRRSRAASWPPCRGARRRT
jgi:tetratricopeptide (TPR) repeat protein